MSVEQLIENNMDAIGLEIRSMALLEASFERTDLMFYCGHHLGHLTIEQADLMHLNRLLYWHQVFNDLSQHPLQAGFMEMCQSVLAQLLRLIVRKWQLYCATDGQYIHWQSYWQQKSDNTFKDELLASIPAEIKSQWFIVHDQWYWLPDSFVHSCFPAEDTVFQWLFPGHHARFVLPTGGLTLAQFNQMMDIIRMDDMYFDQLPQYFEQLLRCHRYLSNEVRRVKQLKASLWWWFSDHTDQILNRWLLHVHELEIQLISAIDKHFNILFQQHQPNSEHHKMITKLMRLGWVTPKQADAWFGTSLQSPSGDTILDVTVEQSCLSSQLRAAIQANNWHDVESVYVGYAYDKDHYSRVDQSLIQQLLLWPQHPFWWRVIGPFASVPKRITKEDKTLQHMYMQTSQSWQSWVGLTDQHTQVLSTKIQYVLTCFENMIDWGDQVSKSFVLEEIGTRTQVLEQLKTIILTSLNHGLDERTQAYYLDLMAPVIRSLFAHDVLQLLDLHVMLRQLKTKMMLLDDSCYDLMQNIEHLCQQMDAKPSWVIDSISTWVKEIYGAEHENEQTMVIFTQQLIRQYPSWIMVEIRDIILNQETLMGVVLQLGIQKQADAFHQSFDNLLYCARQGLMTRFQQRIVMHQCMFSPHASLVEQQSLQQVYQDNHWSVIVKGVV